MQDAFGLQITLSSRTPVESVAGDFLTVNRINNPRQEESINAFIGWRHYQICYILLAPWRTCGISSCLTRVCGSPSLPHILIWVKQKLLQHWSSLALSQSRLNNCFFCFVFPHPVCRVRGCGRGHGGGCGCGCNCDCGCDWLWLWLWLWAQTASELPNWLRP
jgi:hypothetical protein